MHQEKRKKRRGGSSWSFMYAVPVLTTTEAAKPNADALLSGCRLTCGDYTVLFSKHVQNLSMQVGALPPDYSCPLAPTVRKNRTSVSGLHDDLPYNNNGEVRVANAFGTYVAPCSLGAKNVAYKGN